MPADWRRYVAPAAFLLAVTVAVVLVRAGIESGHHGTTESPPASVAETTTTAPPPTTTARATTTVAPKKAYWTVKAGDTFAVIAAQTGVSIATIEQLNPTAKSTSLYIGQKIRTR
jgi:peptidoglycan DL-endopeptidase CwlO